ncbi:beta-galactosidase [Paenibacillus sp. PL91]|uniref:beta-galactosidase n=1 Tax=Paenibacillus sp. PL91 TaxID=2729538 RepID=UPI00145D3DD6|nr:beta-galactosidase [Paenibacillus sp. PL91]MBC9202087.1 beta-galactosidase [Paenibacillus sp. PL91]
MKHTDALKEFHLGVCYYPEHWPESLWEDDFRRMRELGFSIVRVAEFAWSIFEPQEGVFSFELFDRALDLAHKHGLKVIVGTPTATPPAWLTHKYPEVLNVTQDGVTLHHGLRRHYNYSSQKYRELSAIITRQMAEHYKNHPAVIGWQIDNEFNCEISEFYAPADHDAFRVWLQEKYGSLERLNEAWGTVFWSQTYSDWEQVFLPRPTPAQKQPNPHQALDEKRFISDNTISYAKVQGDILREVAPNHWVTTNGLFGHLDSHRMNDELLDFFSYDSYPQFSTIFYDKNEENPLADRGWSQTLGAVRSISPNFAIMEQQSGPGGWVNRMDMPSPKPGQMRLWTYQSIAHGANMVLYFRWRTATVGNEIYWHGINDYHNKPNRRVREAGQIGAELAQAGNRIAATQYKAEVALLRDYDNEWDGEYDVWHGPFARQSGKAWFKALNRRHIPTDTLYVRSGTTSRGTTSGGTTIEDLRRYKVLVYPHPAIMRDETAALLEQYTREGGIVIFGCRTGYKNEHGHCYMRPFPGAAAGLCGISVEEFTMVKGTRAATSMKWSGGSEALTGADSFNDILCVESDSVEVVAHYASDYYAGKPAVTKNSFGKGQAWYFGAVFNEASAAQMIEQLGLVSPAASWLTLPHEVELAIREDEAGPLHFLLNYSEQPATITLSEEKTDLLTGNRLSGTVTLEGYGVVVLS